ncbi:MAG: carbohydrate ABC transporter permease [Treponemataceae bacterium]|nr:carbohydrate ABC transporter permease [Treponemataceae bacterium]
MATNQKMSNQKVLSNVWKYAFCILVSLFVLFPVYMCVVGGFKTTGGLRSDPVGLPNPWEFKNYTDILTGQIGAFWRFLGNSLIIAALTVSLTLAVCIPAAFAIARIKFRLSNIVRAYFMAGLLFPLAVAMLPLYIQVRDMNLIDNVMGVVLPQIAFQIPMNILLLIGFFKAVPNELEDATKIDGYGPLGFLIVVVLPLSTPILATTAIIVLIASWNNFLLPMLVFSSETLYTLPLGVMSFQGQYSSSWSMILSYLTLTLIPAVILFVSAQKYIVAGLTGGAVKG